MVWCGVVHLTWPSRGDVAYACTKIQQVAEEEEEEEEGDTPHIDTWCNSRVWVDSLVVCINDKFVT
jgi:hypothetical protein